MINIGKMIFLCWLIHTAAAVPLPYLYLSNAHYIVVLASATEEFYPTVIDGWTQDTADGDWWDMRSSVVNCESEASVL